MEVVTGLTPPSSNNYLLFNVLISKNLYYFIVLSGNYQSFGGNNSPQITPKM